MIKKIIVFWVVKAIIIGSGYYLYQKGLQNGEQHYKQSHRMYMALKSAYHFGWMDGHEGRREDWDGPDLDTIHTDPQICIANVTEQDIQAIVEQSDATVTGLPHQPRWVTLDGKECK